MLISRAGNSTEFSTCQKLQLPNLIAHQKTCHITKLGTYLKLETQNSLKLKYTAFILQTWISFHLYKSNKITKRLKLAPIQNMFFSVMDHVSKDCLS